MSIRDTTTYEELKKLIEVPAMAICWTLEVKVFADEEDIGVGQVLSLHSFSDYQKAYYASQFLTLQVDPLAYRKMTKHTNKLRVELVRAQQTAEGYHHTEIKRFTQHFKGVMTESPNQGLVSARSADHVKGGHTEQLSNLVEVSLELLEPIVNEFRYAEVGGIYHNTDLKTLLETLMGYGLPESPNKSLLEDLTYDGIRGVDVIKPDNTRTYQHVIIPNGTRLANLPKFLQEHYGLYNTGLGWCIEKQRCFIFPLLKNTEYDKRHKKLTILNIPPNEIPVMEKTFLIYPDQIYVFSTGETQHVDNTERIQTNLGNGIRYTRAGDLVDDMEESTNNKSIWDAAAAVKSFLIDKRPDEKQNVRFVPGRITDNPYKYLSRIATGVGTTLRISWHNADPLLLYPGMQAKILYKDIEDDKAEMKSIEGVLVGVDQYTAPASDMITDRYCTTDCHLYIHVKRLPEIMK